MMFNASNKKISVLGVCLWLEFGRNEEEESGINELGGLERKQEDGWFPF